MPEEQLPGVCWICKWVMKKVKQHLGNRESAVSDTHHTIGKRKKTGALKFSYTV